jgi:hypothetical protein
MGDLSGSVPGIDVIKYDMTASALSTFPGVWRGDFVSVAADASGRLVSAI